MARSLQITCDGCGRQKQDNNESMGIHWWCISITAYRPERQRIIMLANAETACSQENWQDGAGFAVHDFCSQLCALKFVAAQMEKAQN